MPQYYWDETKEFRGTESFFSLVSKYRRQEYYSKLRSYEDLTNFINKYTSGATTVISKIVSEPYEENNSKIIEDMNEIEDGKYMYVIYFVE